ncbi:MAG TPA: amino acid adenylation domain-containing protein, partial [Verrucomicrobiae bacterium]|nr:amino acid adenylation domain-containing protein [Verrucomicrobiae bacterium]
TDLFDGATIARMSQHLQLLLEAIVEDPCRRLSEIDMLSAEEREQMVVQWNRTEREYPGGRSMVELFEAQAEQRPLAVAVVYEDQALTYRELNERANQLAHYLRERGVGPEALVGICMERSLEMVVGLMGILKAGGAYVPLDPQYPEERLAFMLEDARVGVLLTQERFRERAEGKVEEIICLDSWTAGDERKDNPGGAVWAKSMAYMIYTSGSTGNPKGAINTHEGILNRLQWMQDIYRLEEGDRVLQKTPYTFDVSVWEFFWPLMSGSRLVMAQPGGHKDVPYLIRLMEREKITTVHFVPSMLQVFLEGVGTGSCSGLKRVICSGEALKKELVERFFERLPGQLHNLYGPTEASVDVTSWECPRQKEGRVVPIGKPIANMAAHILDRNLNPLPAGITGELHLGGVGLGRGYLGRVELTAEKFIPNPFGKEPGERLYRTGDLARYLPDGNIEFLGRVDHQVKIRGNRIELGEIEAALGGHPEVRENVVVVQEAEGEKRLVGYVAIKEGSERQAAELRDYLKERLPEYMVPAFIVALASLPLTANGKVDRKRLPEPDRDGAEAFYVEPQARVEKTLALIWCKLLRLEKVGMRDNFFELGGHSILSTQLIFRVREEFGIEVPLASFFAEPTIAELAVLLRKAIQEGPDSIFPWLPLVPLQTNGKRKALFLVQPLVGTVNCFTSLVQYLGRGRPVYGLQPPAWNKTQGANPLISIEELASRYIEEISAVEPEGPYFLGGWSIGGNIAFEIAQQFVRQKRPVAFVGLFDTIATSQSDGPEEDFDEGVLLVDWIRSRETICGQPLGVSFDELNQIQHDERLAYVVDRLKSVNLLSADTEVAKVRQIIREHLDQKTPLDYYVPQVYPGELTLFKAADDERSAAAYATDPTLGWDRLSPFPIKIHKTPGKHVTMVFEPHVRVLARKLRDSLKNAEAKYESDPPNSSKIP